MTATDLPDINVWLAFVDENHVHHKRAKDYWKTEAAENVSFNRITSLGFLRLACIIPAQPLTPREAWETYQQLKSLAEVTFTPEPLALDSALETICLKKDFVPRLWTDAYLAAFAKSLGFRLVTFDKDYRRFTGLSLLHLQD